jgi:hypothetical protein
MGRPVTLFTGQWADLTLEDLAKKVSEWGFDGLELACWGDHFEVDKALAEDGYVQGRWDILNKYNLKCFAISTHLVGQCVADDPIDERHKRILPERLWGDGDPEGVRQRCAEELKNTALAALYGRTFTSFLQRIRKISIKAMQTLQPDGNPLWMSLRRTESNSD